MRPRGSAARSLTGETWPQTPRLRHQAGLFPRLFRSSAFICVHLWILFFADILAAVAAEGDRPIVLRAWGVPEQARSDVSSLAERKIIEAYQQRFPHVQPVPVTGLVIPGRQTKDVLPLMQIAGDIAPDVLYVNFRQSDTFIRSKFLCPLDRRVEALAGVDIPDRHLLGLDEYLRRLAKGPGYAGQIKDRVPYQCWQVMRRECPYGRQCPYLGLRRAQSSRGEAASEPASEPAAGPPEKHYHVWCFPVGPDFIALFYRKDLFYEAGLPDRVPETIEEMLQWCRRLTNPREDRYGLQIEMSELGWSTLSFLYSLGGRVVEQGPDGDWRCCFDTEQAVEAYYQVARFFLEPFENRHGRFTGVVYLGEPSGAGEVKCGMFFAYITQQFFAMYDPAQYGFGPVPKGPTGLRGAEFNAMMVGIYAGLEADAAKRDAAWEYIRFYDGPESRLIRARTMLENGLGRYVRPRLLEMAGYPEYIRQVPAGWEQAAEAALANGVPEPYGRNCQQVYLYVSKAINQIRTDGRVVEAMERFDGDAARRRIREILADRVRRSNEKMLNILTDDQRRVRNNVALGVAVAIFLVFAAVLRHVLRVFARVHGGPASAGEAKGDWLAPQGRACPQPPLSDRGQARPRRLGRASPLAGRAGPLAGRAGRLGRWQLGRYKWAYLMLLPAVGTILLWQYWPLVRGTLIAFQDYNVRGFSRWVGMENFANVLFDDEFWYAMWVSVQYTLLYVCFGFASPIILAFLLTEVPRGKVLFRTVYYLPAVLTGVVVIFLWKGFYGRYGMINRVLNAGVWLLNLIPGVSVPEVATAWLDSPSWALVCCLLPTIWAGMGPGCLIYLAALKTVPEELYEAADIDGAGLWAKVRHVALPGIRALILINFVGAIIGVMQTGGGFILAMTGGGPYTPYGRTEVIGLHIFWQAFGYLRFGPATAMAWVLGAMLIGFTVVQLQRLSRMEFRAARGVGE